VPAKSQKQFRWLQLMAHNPEKARQAGIKPPVAQEFIDSTPSFKELPKVKKPKKLRMDY
jgi:hypothetical protein